MAPVTPDPICPAIREAYARHVERRFAWTRYGAVWAEKARGGHLNATLIRAQRMFGERL